MFFTLFVWVLAVVQSFGVGMLILLRCEVDNGLDCSDTKGKSFSYLIDYKWITTLSAVLLGGSAFLNVWFAFGLFFPCYRRLKEDALIWIVRFLHAGGFIGVAMVGVFDLNNFEERHMAAAFFLFIALSLECVLILFIPNNICNVQKLVFPNYFRSDEETVVWDKRRYRLRFSLQIVHALLIPTFAVLYVVTDQGYFEWMSIWLILFYYTYLARDHQKDTVHTDLVEHPDCPEQMYAEMKPMMSLFRINVS